MMAAKRLFPDKGITPALPFLFLLVKMNQGGSFAFKDFDLILPFLAAYASPLMPNPPLCE